MGNIAHDIIRDFGRLRSQRGNWESHWREISERIVPNDSQIFQSNTHFKNQGEKKTSLLFDSTGQVALGRFTAILDSLLTPVNQTWHRLRATDPNLNKIREVGVYFDEITRILFNHRYTPKANFAGQNQQVYQSTGAYGTGGNFIDELSVEPGIRYKFCHLNELFLRENHQGVVDTVYRYFGLTARQAFQKWGDKLPDRIKSKLGTDPDCEFYFIHCVTPRQDRDISRLDFKGMKYASYYVAEEGQVLLSEGGYRTFPYAISRYYPDLAYGRSPAMDVLPAIKTLNEEKKTLLKQGHRALDPILLAHDDGVLDEDLVAGKINFGGVDANGRPLVHALPTGNIAIGKDLMDDERAVINDAFLVTLFQILVETPTMTATEVLERTREKGMLIAPAMGRQRSEYLGSMIERELDVLDNQNLLPPPPPVLVEAQGEYEVVYDSPLSRAQRAEEAAGLMRSVESTLNIVNVTQDPAPLDHYDWDVIVPEINAINGVPAKWMKDIAAVEEIRAQRAEAQQVQQMTDAAPGAAALINAGAKANAG